MANIRLADVVASFESWLITNWPDPSVDFVPSNADTRRPNDAARQDTQVEAQWVSFEPIAERASQDRNAYDLRLIVQTASNDRLRCSQVADELRGLIRNAVVQVVDRGDSSTARGWIRVNEVGITPAQRDARGKVVAVVDVTGWAHSA